MDCRVEFAVDDSRQQFGRANQWQGGGGQWPPPDLLLRLLEPDLWLLVLVFLLFLLLLLLREGALHFPLPPVIAAGALIASDAN